MLVGNSHVSGISVQRYSDGMFYCPRQCSRKYKYKKGLVRHLKYECGIEPQFKCLICGKTYKQPETFKMHLMSIHGIDKSFKRLK